MKILAVSLLRLGDFLQIVPVLHAIVRKYPNATVDVLTFEPVRGLQPLMPLPRRWWTLDRDELQSGLGRGEIPLLTSYDVLKEQLERVQAENYDLVINLTQTGFSGWICGYLQAKEKLGLCFNVKGQALFHSPWFRYLDERAQVNSPDIFNYTDIFLNACGAPEGEKLWSLRSTERGQAEVRSLGLAPGGPVIVCQMFTSDSKKNWSESAWVDLLDRLQTRLPAARMVLLGSPQEASRVAEVAARANAAAVQAILSLEGALALLEQSDLLITGDTSVKHLANASAKIRILELSIGSSDHLRTGVYKENSLILKARVPCAPCPHASPCSQSTHLCARSLDPSVVAEAAVAHLHGDWTRLSQLAKRTAEASFLRTHHLETGFWFAAELGQNELLPAVDALVERCTWKFLLNQDDKRSLPAYGSESVRLGNEIHKLFHAANLRPVLEHLNFLEENATRSVPAFSAIDWNADEITDLVQVRRAQVQDEQRARQAKIKFKLVRTLKNRLMES